MHFGLTFIAAANQRATADDWKRQLESLDRHQRLMLSPSDLLTSEERQVLQDLAAQLASGKLPTSNRRCPECERSLARVTLLGVELDCCASCHGIWFDPGELQLFSGQDKEIPSDDKTHRASRFGCPDCGAWMIEYTFLNPKSLLVDRCPNGHGVYLEERELERVFEIV